MGCWGFGVQGLGFRMRTGSEASGKGLGFRGLVGFRMKTGSWV